MLPSSPLENAAYKIQLTVSILTSCNFLLLLVSFGFNSQISILVQLLRFPQAFINVGIIAFASLKTPLSNPRVTAAAAAAASRAGASSSYRGRSRSRRRRYIVLSCCSACLILVLILLASLILPSAAKAGSALFLILGTLNILVASFLLADAVLLDMHRRREKKSGPAGTSSSSTTSSSVSNTDQQPQLPQFHVYQPRLSFTSDRVVVQEDGGDTELEPLPKYQPQEPEHHAPTIIIDLANLEPGQHHHQQQQQQQQQLAVGRATSSVEQDGNINSSSGSSRGSRSSRSSSRSRGHGPLTMGGAESDSRRTSWEDVETGIVPDYSQATTAGGQTAAERSASVLLPSTTTTTTATESTSDDHDHVHHHDSGTPPTGSATSPNTSAAAEGAAEDVTESAATATVLTSIPTSAPPVYAP